MRFLHLGDLHLGKSLLDFDLISDQKYLLDQIFDMIRTKKIDAVLIAGDIYDKSIPSEAAVRLFDSFIRRLAEEKILTFIISGNHDSEERLNFGSSLFELSDIYIAAKYEGVLYEKTVFDEEGEIHIWLLPFVKASVVRHYFPEEKIDSYEKAVRIVLEHAQIDRTKRNIILAHQFVTGENLEEPELGGSEGLSVQSVGLIEKISYRCFDDFDYVALGHIHSPQRVGRDEVRYSGSLMKYSLREARRAKTLPVITMGKKGEIEIETVELKPLHDLRHIKGTMENLLKKENIVNPEDYIYVTLMDEDIITDAVGIFRQHYPNMVKLDYDNSHTQEIESIDFSKIGEKKEFPELIADFYHQMYGCEISEEEQKIMREVAREAGVHYEAD